MRQEFECIKMIPTLFNGNVYVIIYNNQIFTTIGGFRKLMKFGNGDKINIENYSERDIRIIINCKSKTWSTNILSLVNIKKMAKDLEEIERKYKNANKYFPDPIEYLNWLRHKVMPEMEKLNIELEKRLDNGLTLSNDLPWGSCK